MSKKINIDDSIREKLDGFSAAPPPHVWNNIQAQMNVAQKKRRLAYIGWISAAAVVLLAFIAGWYFNGKSVIEKPIVVEQQASVPANNEDAGTQHKNRTETESGNPDNNADSFVAEKKDVPAIKRTETREHTTDFSAGDKYVAESGSAHDLERQRGYSLLKRIEALLTKELPQVALENRSKETGPMVISSADEALIAENLRNMNTQKSGKHGWIVGAQISPGYSSHSANHNDDYARNMNYNSNNGGSNIGGGISVQYKTSKRLRVESGIYYAKDGQKADNSFRLFASNKQLLYDAAAPAFSNLVQTGDDGIAMNSTAGVIEMKSTPRGANIAANLENTDETVDKMLYADGEFSQVFEFVEVPLYLRYSVLDKKLGIDLLGGISAGFVIGNNAYLDNDYGVQNIGSTADISTLNFSGTVGVGFNYSLGKHFSLALEPRLNYYLSSINSNPDVDYRPYRLGVYTGVYYEF